MKSKKGKNKDLVPKEDIKVLDAPAVSPLLKGQDDPEHALKLAQKYTKVLVSIIDNQKDDKGRPTLYSIIQGRKYIRVEGWTALAGMVGVFPHTVYAKRLERGAYETAYEAMVELKNINGQIIASAEAFCSNQETGKKDNPEYAIKSMAITRATGKACRLAFSWIVALAGYETTPAEEMDGIHDNSKKHPASSPKQTKKTKPQEPQAENSFPVTIAQATVIIQNIIGSHLTHNFEKWRYAKTLFDGQNLLTKNRASEIIEWWIGKKSKSNKIIRESERANRTKLEKQDENGEALKNFFNDIYEKYKNKYPEELKKYSHYCGLPKEKLPFDVLDTKGLYKAYLEFRKILGLDDDGGA